MLVFQRWVLSCLCLLAIGRSAVLGAVPSPGESVTLAWNASPSGLIAGYHLYLGTATKNYSSVFNIPGGATSFTIPGLVAGVTYFFAVTAYDSIGLESAFSDEISYAVPTPATAPETLELQLSAPDEVLLRGRGPSGYRYEVLRSEDLTSWSVLGSVTNDNTGTFSFADTLSQDRLPHCYRLRQILP